MTKEQFEDIKSRLAKWREARGLSVEGQKANFRSNYAEELDEYAKGEAKNDEYKMIDSICDMFVVAVNAGLELLADDYLREDVKMPKNIEISQNEMYWLLCGNLSGTQELWRLIVAIKAKGYAPYECLLETIKELESRSGSWNEQEGKWCKDLGAYTFEEAQDDLLEEFDDCVGKYVYFSEDKDYWFFEWHGLGKVEDSDVVKVKKWYKADYSKCKLEVENV